MNLTDAAIDNKVERVMRSPGLFGARLPGGDLPINLSFVK